jgi:hypothetical protein
LGLQGITCWQTDPSAVREIIKHIWDDPVGLHHPEGPARLRRVLENLAFSDAGTPRIRNSIEVIVDQALCPGLLIQLGDQLLPRQVRDSFVRSKYQAVSGIAADQWSIHSQPSWITGPILCFGMPMSWVQAIEEPLRASKPRSISIQPTFVWCWNQRDVQDFSGSFFGISPSELSQAYFERGRPISFESGERSPLQPDLASLRDRHLLLYGIDPTSPQIRVVTLPGIEIVDPAVETSPLFRKFSAIGAIA